MNKKSEKQTIHLSLWATKKEKDKLVKLCAKYGHNYSGMIRHLIMQAK